MRFKGMSRWMQRREDQQVTPETDIDPETAQADADAAKLERIETEIATQAGVPEPEPETIYLWDAELLQLALSIAHDRRCDEASYILDELVSESGLERDFCIDFLKQLIQTGELTKYTVDGHLFYTAVQRRERKG